jgi:ubiquinone/menaquinone biosynthesis C-methylase UbiE
MKRSPLWWLGGGLGAAALLYWQVILAEGAYLGPWAVRLIYSLGASRYDEVRAASQAAADAALRPLLQASLADAARPRILDVATGTGRVPLLLVAEPGFAGQVAALDLTPRMLSEARRKEQAAGSAGRVAWHLAEASDLPWPAAVFDLATCLEALEYFPQPRRALAELARVLRPGGALVLSKFPDGWARLLPGRALTRRALDRELARLGFTAVHVLPWQPDHYELVVAHKAAGRVQ